MSISKASFTHSENISSDPHQVYNSYSRRVGHKGESIVRWTYDDIFFDHDLHYKLNFSKDVQENGPDIVVLDEKGQIKAKFEVLNLQRSSYITEKRARRIRDNLTGAEFVGLIVSFPENLTSKAEKILKGIPICYTYIQILPDGIHDSIPPHKLYRRKKDGINDKTFKELKNRLSSFLRHIGLISHVYKYKLKHGILFLNHSLIRDIKNYKRLDESFNIAFIIGLTSNITHFNSLKPIFIDLILYNLDVIYSIINKPYFKGVMIDDHRMCLFKG